MIRFKAKADSAEPTGSASEAKPAKAPRDNEGGEAIAASKASKPAGRKVAKKKTGGDDGDTLI